MAISTTLEYYPTGNSELCSYRMHCNLPTIKSYLPDSLDTCAAFGSMEYAWMERGRVRILDRLTQLFGAASELPQRSRRKDGILSLYRLGMFRA